MKNENTVLAAVTKCGQRAPVVYRRERNGNYTQHVDISGLSGIQFDARHDAPLVEIPEVQLRDEAGLVFAHEKQPAGTVIVLKYDESLPSAYFVDIQGGTRGCGIIEMIELTLVAA